MTTAKRNATGATSWDRLDAELARWLRARTSLRAARDRDESPLDDVAMALRRVRATLAFAASTSATDPCHVALVSRAYRWSIRIARELEMIEHLALEPIAEWARFEAFAPFALAFFESVVAAPMAAATKTAEVARLARELDAVLGQLSTAMRSSSMAA
ncbi:MAG: hypothetical protein JWP87_3838 [Labilithrix sp.]|nr:hypothetical protein [Labilithrix sp.]